MDLQPDLIDQLEGIVSSRDISKRATILRKVTDLFVVGSGRFSEEHVELFDDVMSKLIDGVERDARAQFGNRLAKLTDAPPRAMKHIALDDAIEVSGPVLQHSDRIDEHTLGEVARIRSHDHLLAISSRKMSAEPVTDILMERGSEAVVTSTARNSGARFSEFGVSNLIQKAGSDESLALSVWSRTDIPRHNLVKLFAEASEALQNRMIQADPRRTELIRAAVAEATDRIQDNTRAISADLAEARSCVDALQSAGKLNEEQLHAFARDGSFEKVTAALSLLCELPIAVVERAFVQKHTDQILVMARAINLSWVTTVALLLLQAGVNGSSRQQLDQCFTRFSRLQTNTARTALQFYRMRKKASRPGS